MLFPLTLPSYLTEEDTTKGSPEVGERVVVSGVGEKYKTLLASMLMRFVALCLPKRLVVLLGWNDIILYLGRYLQWNPKMAHDAILCSCHLQLD